MTLCQEVVLDGRMMLMIMQICRHIVIERKIGIEKRKGEKRTERKKLKREREKKRRERNR